MALINCPECNREVSNTAKNCPHCGFAISEATNDLIRIKIDMDPDRIARLVFIKDVNTKKLLAQGKAGTVLEFRTQTDLRISICGMTGMTMLKVNVSPKNGGKYRASWGMGFFQPTIVTCSPVDVIDS